jgi:hypothetical protein
VEVGMTLQMMVLAVVGITTLDWRPSRPMSKKAFMAAG